MIQLEKLLNRGSCVYSLSCQTQVCLCSATSCAQLEDLAYLDEQQRCAPSRASLRMPRANSGSRSQQEKRGEDIRHTPGGNSRRPQASTNSLISLSAVQLSPYLSLKPLPFEIPGLSSDRSFSGREWLFQEVDNRLSSDDPLVNRGVVIVGSMGFGKTAVIARLAALSCHGDRMWPTSSALQTAPKCKRGRTPSCNRSHPNVQNRICAGIPETFGVRENVRCRHLKTNIVAKRPPPPDAMLCSARKDNLLFQTAESSCRTNNWTRCQTPSPEGGPRDLVENKTPTRS